MSSDARAKDLESRVRSELVDSFDEELEMEIDDARLDKVIEEFSERPEQEQGAVDRATYFQELFRLQGELVKLQDWVVDQKLKVVVIFEGRDAAGKGGVIKRITQRLNPRVCRVVALPAPNERERTQWYFQRYVAHLPAGGEMVLFDRSWYNRAGVERVMGFCTEEECDEFLRTVPEFEKMLVRSGIILIKYWFSITDEEQHFRFMMRIHDPLEAVEAEPDGPGIAAPLGGVHQGQGGDAGAHPHPRGALVDRAGGRQEEGAAQLHPPPAEPGPLRGNQAAADGAAAAHAQPRLPPQSHPRGDVRAGGVLGHQPKDWRTVLRPMRLMTRRRVS